jgi:hypothetical protein
MAKSPKCHVVLFHLHHLLPLGLLQMMMVAGVQVVPVIPMYFLIEILHPQN